VVLGQQIACQQLLDRLPAAALSEPNGNFDVDLPRATAGRRSVRSPSSPQHRVAPVGQRTAAKACRRLFPANQAGISKRMSSEGKNVVRAPANQKPLLEATLKIRL